MMMMIIPQAMCMCIKMLSIVKKTKPPSYITHTSDPDDQDGESKR